MLPLRYLGLIYFGNQLDRYQKRPHPHLYLDFRDFLDCQRFLGCPSPLDQ